MRNIYYLFLLASVGLGMMIFTSATFAQSFELSVSEEETRVGEAIDLTVNVLDDDGEVDTEYTGDIYIVVPDDGGATIPNENDGYTFTPEDQGVVTFSKGLIFSEEALQGEDEAIVDVNVMDIDDNELTATISITVRPQEDTPDDETAEVTIDSPTSNETISDTQVTVTGSTLENSNITIYLNDQEVDQMQTGPDGSFSYDLSGLNQGEENTIQVKVLNGDDEEIGESETITLRVGEGAPSFEDAYFEESELTTGIDTTLVVLADSGLTEVTADFDGMSQVLSEKEETPGTYTVSLTMPSNPGQYPVNVTLKGDMGQVTEQSDAIIANVIGADTTLITNILSLTDDNESINITFSLNREDENIDYFKINYGTSEDDLSQQSISERRDTIEIDTLKYEHRIEGLEQNKYYFQIIGLDEDKEETSVTSGIESFDLSLPAAGSCSIGVVSGLKGETNNKESKITWGVLENAEKYRVFKKKEDGKWSLIDETTNTYYIIPLKGEKVTYDEFAVRGVCSDNTQGDYSNALKVQTGPTEIFILFVVAGVLGYFIAYAYRRKSI